MRKWTRAAIPTLCGGPCGTRIPEGAVMFVLSEFRTFPSVPRKVRCQQCAGEPVPTDVPPLTTVSTKPARLETMSRLGLLPLDREPGQEG
jgi:hypothetical protein